MFANIRNNVVRLITNAGNATSWGPQEVLKDVAANIKPTDRLMVIYGSADLNQFEINYAQCGLTASEMIAILEVAKLNIYINLMSKQKAPE